MSRTKDAFERPPRILVVIKRLPFVVSESGYKDTVNRGYADGDSTSGSAVRGRVVANSLKQYQRAIVRLAFTDGQVVRARIIHVDENDRQEIPYDVMEIGSQLARVSSAS